MATLTLTYDIGENDPKQALADLLTEIAGGTQDITFEHTDNKGEVTYVSIADVVESGLF